MAIAAPANCYVLSGKNGVGFYLYNGANLNPHKAYVINGSSARNGTLLIERNGKTYTAQGAEL